MLKILQARFQQYMNRDLPEVQAGFRKNTGTGDQIANIFWIIEKAIKFQKNIYFMPKPLTMWITTNCGKLLKEMGIPDHLTCLLRNLYAGQKATVWTGHGTTDWLQIGKAVYVKAVYCHPAYLTYMQSTSWETLGWKKHKLESRLSGEISITSITKEPLDESKRRGWKSWLKTQHSKNEDHGIRSHHFMANRWGNKGNSNRWFFLGSKITVDGDCVIATHSGKQTYSEGQCR